MPAPRRVVIDPNVLVSAAITPSGATAAVTDLVDAGIIVPIVSPMLLAELDGVLRRQKFREYLSPPEVDAYVAELARRGEPWDDLADPPTVSPDRDDDYLIALARAAGADALVTGDTDLIELDLPDVPALTPRQLLEIHATDAEPSAEPGAPPT